MWMFGGWWGHNPYEKRHSPGTLMHFLKRLIYLRDRERKGAGAEGEGERVSGAVSMLSSELEKGLDPPTLTS